ncbi:hypothetical protein H112_03087 [Trichophyton rubrum D6]|uniref:SsDNA binding protein n=4 Tax=Trichophyton TaxID=5550 RepID=F2STA3_TRIRC|nr:uncharacterized protein TERG_05704 [Trichophyton rubrum CBS 118892]EZF24404.1 hypothetical protein H100_03093 [Trichophyton rubrum MR850]EZF43444.1 hypothetical protein H102_03086 [Trichophyton rubrum CBS 100081]EZF54012.1 hypothetical protein H103_03100 [Trichophyton rubrum CBS 288.86]EZF64682.1 hypothetical protein H104_03081 [Trichophyton rubrum CBS 289.86]EZF75328.1 hypothetical protein H105_03105 [Trichophyton soudanense CBS 452.61]EZF85918.1 hypothetical protein H110_03094 [Trichophy
MFRQSAFQTLSKAARPITTPVSRSFSSTAIRDHARLTVVGRLGAQPEVATSSNGREYVKYSVGTNYGPRDNQQTSWFRVTSFVPEGPGRDHLLNLPKGTLMLVEGDATMRVSEDNEGRKTSMLGFVQREPFRLIYSIFNLYVLNDLIFFSELGHYEVLSRPFNPNRDEESK